MNRVTRGIVERGGRRFVLVPEHQFREMTAAVEDLDDIRAYDRAKARPQEFVPIAVADRLIAGEPPLRVWREYRKLTQQQLADRAGFSKPYLSQLENGSRDGTVAALKRLAAALSVDLDDLSPAKPRSRLTRRRQSRI
jgi:DNA-binding XRE family transcriptional regulator